MSKGNKSASSEKKKNTTIADVVADLDSSPTESVKETAAAKVDQKDSKKTKKEKKQQAKAETANDEQKETQEEKDKTATKNKSGKLEKKQLERIVSDAKFEANQNNQFEVTLRLVIPTADAIKEAFAAQNRAVEWIKPQGKGCYRVRFEKRNDAKMVAKEQEAKVGDVVFRVEQVIDSATLHFELPSGTGLTEADLFNIAVEQLEKESECGKITSVVQYKKTNFYDIRFTKQSDAEKAMQVKYLDLGNNKIVELFTGKTSPFAIKKIAQDKKAKELQKKQREAAERVLAEAGTAQQEEDTSDASEGKNTDDKKEEKTNNQKKKKKADKKRPRDQQEHQEEEKEKEKQLKEEKKNKKTDKKKKNTEEKSVAAAAAATNANAAEKQEKPANKKARKQAKKN